MVGLSEKNGGPLGRVGGPTSLFCLTRIALTSSFGPTAVQVRPQGFHIHDDGLCSLTQKDKQGVNDCNLQNN